MNEDFFTTVVTALIAQGFCEKMSADPIKDFPIVLEHIEGVLKGLEQ